MMRNDDIEPRGQRIVERQPIHGADVVMQNQNCRAATPTRNVEFDAGNLFDRIGPDDAHSWFSPLSVWVGRLPVGSRVCPIQAPRDSAAKPVKRVTNW